MCPQVVVVVALVDHIPPGARDRGRINPRLQGHPRTQLQRCRIRHSHPGARPVKHQRTTKLARARPSRVRDRPVVPVPDESCRTAPAPSSNAYAATRLPVAARPLEMTPVAAISPLAAAANAMTLAMRDDILDPAFGVRMLPPGVSTPLAATLRRCSVAVLQERRRPQGAGAPASRPENVTACFFSPYRPRRQTPERSFRGRIASWCGLESSLCFSGSRRPSVSDEVRTYHLAVWLVSFQVILTVVVSCICFGGIDNQARPEITQAGVPATD